MSQQVQQGDFCKFTIVYPVSPFGWNHEVDLHHASKNDTTVRVASVNQNTADVTFKNHNGEEVTHPVFLNHLKKIM